MSTVTVLAATGSTAWAALTGALTLVTGDVVLRKLTSLVDRGYVHLVVDASAVRFCDSMGLGALLRARARASAAAGGLIICAASPPLRRALEIAGLRKLLAD